MRQNQHSSINKTAYCKAPWFLAWTEIIPKQAIGFRNTVPTSFAWDKRDRLAQMAFPTIATLMPPITSTKGQGFYVELFYKGLPN